MIRSLLLSFLVLCVLTAFGQSNQTVKGIVADSAANVRLANASITIIHGKDSMLYKFTRADKDGKFSIGGMAPGNYVLLLSYPDYADYTEKFSLEAGKDGRDFGRMNMKTKANLLQEVIVKGAAAQMKIKGDTTEYDAKAFVIEANAKVEDLIKQFPGIQVDKDGNITAQGEKISKVLVDGEEFFGDDPTLVTKNLRADMVDKVQLYDKKSDQATFTGIDDGQKEKVLNVKLKEDKKSGYFGKLEAGAGNDEYYVGQAMFNAFKGKQRIAGYGVGSNTATIGLGWQDSEKYGGSSGGIVSFGDGGEMMVMVGGSGGDEMDSFDGSYRGRGVPYALNGGAHFSNKWKEDKHGMNVNYKVGKMDTEGNSSSIRQTNLPTSILNNNDSQNFDNSLFRQKLDVAYDAKLSETSNLKITLSGMDKTSESATSNLSLGTRGDNTRINQGLRDLNSDVHQQNFVATAFWTKKLKKTGRTMSWNLSQTLSNSDSEGFLLAQNQFYNTSGALDSTQVIDQLKLYDTRSAVFGSNFTYTEPLSKTVSLMLNYGFGLNNGSSNRQSFNKTGSGQYDDLDESLSNNFELDQMTNQAGAIFNFKKGKNTVNFGTKMTFVDFKQRDLVRNTVFDRDFINWNPQANYRYAFSQQRSFNIGYSGSNQQPNINQIQPVRENTDPLNVVLGNPDLKPSYRNNFNFGYNDFKILTNRYINFYGGFTFTSNQIVNNYTIDQAGKSTSQFVNIGEMPSSFFGGFSFGRKIKKPELQLNANLSANGNTYYNFINNALNKTKAYNYNFSLGFSQYKAKKYNWYISFGPGYTSSEASLQNQLNSNGMTFNSNANFIVYLPGKVEIVSDGNYQFNAKTQSFANDFNRTIWNASVSKKFGKADAFKMTVSGRDLLNQNTGFNRTAFNGQIIQNNYTTIRRYFLFSLSYDFNKMGGGAPATK